MLYLHELVSTVPGRTEDYLDSMAEHHGTSAARRGQKDSMLGLWSTLEASGTWPRAVNFWQYGDWDGVAAQLARQFEPQSQDPGLKAWWLGNLDLRTGGFDRLVESTDYTLDVAGLRKRGVAGALFLHQIVTLAPGAREEFLTALGEEGVAGAEKEGAELVGAYRVRLRSDEALVIFAFREPSELARFQNAWHAPSGGLRRWREREDRWVCGKESSILRSRYFLSSPWHL